MYNIYEFINNYWKIYLVVGMLASLVYQIHKEENCKDEKLGLFHYLIKLPYIIVFYPIVIVILILLKMEENEK